MTAHETPLVILLPELALGGLLRHASELARQAKREGQPATIVSVRGEQDVSEHLAGLDVRLVESWRGAGQKQVLQWMEGADVLLLSSPQTALLAPALCVARSAAVGVHGRPEPTGSGSARSTRGAGHRRWHARGPQVLVPGRAYVDGVAREFDISTAQVSVLPNATSLPESPPTSSRGWVPC